MSTQKTAHTRTHHNTHHSSRLYRFATRLAIAYRLIIFVSLISHHHLFFLLIIIISSNNHRIFVSHAFRLCVPLSSFLFVISILCRTCRSRTPLVSSLRYACRIVFAFLFSRRCVPSRYYSCRYPFRSTL